MELPVDGKNTHKKLWKNRLYLYNTLASYPLYNEFIISYDNKLFIIINLGMCQVIHFLCITGQTALQLTHFINISLNFHKMYKSTLWHAAD